MKNDKKTKKQLIKELSELRKRFIELEAKYRQPEKNSFLSINQMAILFEYAPDGFYLSDLKGNLLDGNKAA